MCELFDYDGSLIYEAMSENEIEAWMEEDVCVGMRFLDDNLNIIPCIVKVDINGRSNNIKVADNIKKQIKYVFFRTSPNAPIPVGHGQTLMQILKDCYLYGYYVFTNGKRKGIRVDFTKPRANGNYIYY